METFLNIFVSDFKPELLKIITFVWNVLKCIILFVIAIKITGFFSKKAATFIENRIDCKEQQQQLLTLKTTLCHLFHGFISVIFLINMLNLFGIDVKPILATAGVLGVAVGFGAKRTVEDVLSGLIIILEGQIRVGDYVDIEGAKGFVEKITLPLITLRAFDTGAIHYIRCGYIDKIINYTMTYSYAFFEFDVGYEQNIDKVIRVIKEAFNELKSNENYRKLIIEDIEILGLDEFKSSSLCVKSRIKTQPKEQWTIKRAFNKIIKDRFDKENIEIPYNQIVVSKKQDRLINEI